jgi:signal transduction histidine kinase
MPDTRRARRLRIAWTVGGGLFGALIPLVGWLVATSEPGGFDLARAHRRQPVLWIVDLAPLLLGVVGWVIGSLYARVDGAHVRDEELVEALTTELETANTKLADTVSSRNQFVGTVSHELRTPVTAILGFGEELLDAWEELDDPHRKDMVNVIAHQARDITEMLDDLLVASRTELGSLVITREPTDLAEVAAECLRSFRPSRAKAVTRRLEQAPVVADGGRVRQIVRNLLSNAERYGGEEIEVQSGVAGNVGFIRVVDNGPGVPDAEAGSIFLPYRTASTSGRRSGSVGLGLSVSRTLAGLMGGELAYRRAGDRTVFELKLLVADTKWPIPLTTRGSVSFATQSRITDDSRS